MMREVTKLVWEFRKAIEKAKKDHVFDNDICFDSFPHACCGPTSNMLAKYLHENGIDTISVNGWFGNQSHEWLVLKDENIKKPLQQFLNIPEEIQDVWSLYSGRHYDGPVDITHYQEEDVDDGIIIDITADQFVEMKAYPVFIGGMNDFHKKFEFEQAHDYSGLNDLRLRRLYEQIYSYIN